MEDVGYEDSGGGRPRGLIAVATGGGVLVGVDVAERHVHVELFNPKLEVLAEARLHPGDNRPDQLVRHIVTGVRSVLEQPAGGRNASSASGCACPVSWSPLPGQPLRASTAAELRFGAGRGRDDVVVLTLGTGVRAGPALGGSVRAGEWGHTTLVLDGRPCRCGSRGCVEAYAGAGGIVQHLRDLAPDSPLLRPGRPTDTIDALARAAAEGDPAAAKAVAETPATSGRPSPVWST